MLPATLLLAATLTVLTPSTDDLTPGDGLGLISDAPATPMPGGGGMGSVPGGGVPMSPLGFTAALGALAAGLAALGGTRPVVRDDEPIVVMVPGWGSASGEAVFGELVDLMGVDPGDVRYFDYRWAATAEGHGTASRAAHIDQTAVALNGYVAGLAAETDRDIFLVGFSKGGVTVAEMLAKWDEGGGGVTDVSGAVILDAPMATGLQGFTQSLGDVLGMLPDDGGYDPVSCRVGPFWCKDDRAHLGRESGVPVAVVRNPKAWLTNFDDLPPGLRVYDAPDNGPDFLETLATRPWALPARVTEAHDSVLSNPDVAACIVAEMRTPGTCDLERVGRHPGPAVWPGTKPKWGPTGSVPV